MSGTSSTSFASVLRGFRRSAQLTQEELAERAGLSVRTISDLERALKTTPQASTLDLLAHALELSPEDRKLLVDAAPKRRHRLTDKAKPETAYLPADMTPLIGREQDVEDVVELLRSSDVRMVTMIGPGGVGKTRLALRVTSSLSPDFPDGVSFVPLAPITSPTLIPDALVAALGAQPDNRQSSVENAVAFLRERTSLLVLDNFEHLTSGALFISDLLAACPGLTVLATSRSPLRLRAETLYDVQPLKSPAPDETLTVGAAFEYSAIKLFTQRAQSASPSFGLAEDEIGTVAQICRRLDSLPLALELAAAQIRYMSPAALLARLQRGTDFLPPGPIDAPPRQQTVRDTIGWSYGLLDDEEQAFFRALSVFVGGCTAEGAEALGLNDDRRCLELLHSLMDKSLVYASATDSPEPRFLMLETVREYGLEQAKVAGETDRLRKRHAAYFLALSHRAGDAQKEAGPSSWSLRLRADHPNLLAALNWFSDIGQASEALELASEMVEYWIPWGYVREGRDWMEKLLAAAAEGKDDVPAGALTGTARLAAIQGDFPRSVALYEQAVAVYHRLGQLRGVAINLNNLGTVAHMQTDYDRATSYYEQALSVARSANERYGMAMPLTNLGVIAMQQGEYVKAAELMDEALDLWRALGYDQKLAITLGNRANLAFRQDNHEEAVTLQEEALAMKRGMGDMLAVATSLADLALAKIERGRYEDAREHTNEALEIFRGADHKNELPDCLEATARIAQRTGQLDRATRLYAGEERLRAELGVERHPADQPRHEAYIAALKSSCDPARFAATWRLGRLMPLENLLRYAALTPLNTANQNTASGAS